MDNILNARIKLKYDTYEHWESVKNSFKPLAGEVILYQIPAQQTSTGLTPPTVGVKVGDGTNFLKDLPWIQAVAGDVYSWAKAENKPTYNAREISAEKETTSGGSSSTTNTTVNQWLQDLTNDLAGLSGGAGSISTQIDAKLANLDVTNNLNPEPDEHTITGFSQAKTLATLIETNGYISATFQDILIAQSQVSGLTDALAAKAPLASPTFTGIVKVPAVTSTSDDAAAATKKYVDDKTAGLSSAMHYKGTVAADPTVTAPTDSYESGDVVTNSNKEYVYDGSAWRELGDEGSYALKTITVTGDNGLTGGGTLTENRAISHATPTGASAGTLGTAGGRQYVQTLTTDKFGHVTGATYGTETVADNNTTYEFAVGDNDGEVKITAIPHVNGSAGIATSANIKPKNLKTVATSGSAYDLNEVNTSTSTASNGQKFFILDCGDATHFIDNKPTTQT